MLHRASTLLMRNSTTSSLTLRSSVRMMSSGYPQPPLSTGKGAKDGVIPSDDDQATGREREELKALAQGKEYFNRQPIRMQKGQGTFANPVLIPSEEPARIVGQVPKGQDGPIWFEVTNEGVHYVPELGLHYKLQKI